MPPQQVIRSRQPVFQMVANQIGQHQSRAYLPGPSWSVELSAMSIHHGQKLHLDTGRVRVQLMDHRKPTARNRCCWSCCSSSSCCFCCGSYCSTCSGTSAKWVEKQLRKTKPAIMIMPSAERVKDFNVVISSKQNRLATVNTRYKHTLTE